MGELQLGIIVILYLFYGLYALQRERKRDINIQLCILVQRQEENIEGIIRYLVRQIYRQCFAGQLVIFSVGSSDGTGAILHKLAQKMSFIVREIKSECRLAAEIGKIPEEERYLVDLRKKKEFPVELFKVMQKLKHFKTGLMSST